MGTVVQLHASRDAVAVRRALLHHFGRGVPGRFDVLEQLVPAGADAAADCARQFSRLSGLIGRGAPLPSRLLLLTLVLRGARASRAHGTNRRRRRARLFG